MFWFIRVSPAPSLFPGTEQALNKLLLNKYINDDCNEFSKITLIESNGRKAGGKKGMKNK